MEETTNGARAIVIQRSKWQNRPAESSRNPRGHKETAEVDLSASRAERACPWWGGSSHVMERTAVVKG